MFVPSHRELEKWDKVGQRSAFFIMVATIYVTFVKDQCVKRMFTPSLRVYHTCQWILNSHGCTNEFPFMLTE